MLRRSSSYRSITTARRIPTLKEVRAETVRTRMTKEVKKDRESSVLSSDHT